MVALELSKMNFLDNSSKYLHERIIKCSYYIIVLIRKSKSALSKLARKCKANTIEAFISLLLLYNSLFYL